MPEDLHRRIVHKLVKTHYANQLINNVDRGHYIECMIVLALGNQWSLTSARRGWAPWDIERENDGARLEVKQSAALQTWSPAQDAPRPRPASFDIAYRKEPWTKGGDFAPYCPGRPADVYIFAWHPIVDNQVADHRSAEQWNFFVVPERELPDQKTISINRVKNLATEIKYARLADDVAAKLALLNQLKVEEEINQGHYVKPSRFDSRKPGE